MKLSFRINLVIAVSFILFGRNLRAAEYYDPPAVQKAIVGDVVGGITYNVSFPALETREFIEETSFLGFTVEMRKLVAPRISIGFSYGWYKFHEKTNEPISLGTQNVNGSHRRLLYATPIFVNTHYYGVSKDRQHLIPFAGLNVGTYRIKQELEVGSDTFGAKDWHWGIAPEIGAVLHHVGSGYLWVGVKYHQAFASEDDYNFWSLFLGLGYIDWTGGY